MGRSIFRWGYWISPEKRKNVLHNLHIICGEGDHRQKAREVFSSFGRYFVEFLSSVHRRKCLMEETQTFGTEHMLNAAQKGKGVIVVTAHLGNWELAALVTVKLGIPLEAVFFTHPNPFVNQFFIRQRNMEGYRIIPWKQDATRRCLEALRAGRFLAIAGDVDFPGTGVEVNFFEKKTKIPRGPAVFSKRTGAPIVCGLYHWSDRGGVLVFDEPIDPNGRSEEEIAARLAKNLERAIRSYPSQWICFERMWK